MLKKYYLASSGRYVLKHSGSDGAFFVYGINGKKNRP